MKLESVYQSKENQNESSYRCKTICKVFDGKLETIILEINEAIAA